MEIFFSKGEKETFEIGLKISKFLVCGDVLLLSGEIGAGKTNLAKGICEGLGICETITSPTFTIANEYKPEKKNLQGLEKVVHFDFYRIEREDEFYNLGLDDYFCESSICLIEWYEKAKNFLPVFSKKVTIEFVGFTERKISFSGSNPKP
ncbi:tRNA (adenosine(37)-N6)-threonylcarbamoyltransferase complex ATPase subunit type 1 TsaE [bacterium]|nr:tRNA (adenosine(37)-N6)-threonylcarbamoyltransferase complex ATPase subunit type 1 TsaE [bacterium]